MTSILGFNAYHADSVACLARDGEMIAAAEEERFRPVKHWTDQAGKCSPSAMLMI